MGNWRTGGLEQDRAVRGVKERDGGNGHEPGRVSGGSGKAGFPTSHEIEYDRREVHFGQDKVYMYIKVDCLACIRCYYEASSTSGLSFSFLKNC
jgi:hypothetical protein